MDKPKVGDVLYSLNVCEQKLTPVNVVKVGRKYFYCRPYGSRFDTAYHIENWKEKSGYPIHSILYASKQAWEEKKESSEICSFISNAFQYGRNRAKLSLDDLRKIKDIMENNRRNHGKD
ncbi:MAG: hypothetical protein GY800_09095 [Planctomycetes bacterium]|nr:hypothetical protein [Planctomycetota bacterium]